MMYFVKSAERCTNRKSTNNLNPYTGNGFRTTSTGNRVEVNIDSNVATGWSRAGGRSKARS